MLLLDVVGLTAAMIDRPETPHLSALAARGACAPMTGILPAVTLSAQATMLTGEMPAVHGAVGNGWHDRELGETAFWRQSNALVTGEKIYAAAAKRDPNFTCAKIFWWWNMGADVTWSVTPRPFYPADGRKILSVYSQPLEYREELESELGAFPFFQFWGPKSGLASSRWIADATIKTLREKRPSLTMAYLPHLDYDLQRFGPDHPRCSAALAEIDSILGDLIGAADEVGAEIMIVSEYGIEAVSAVLHPNRILREAGLLSVRPGPIGDLLDFYASRAFAVSDHQLAHVYVKRELDVAAVCRLFESTPGVEQVLHGESLAAAGLNHARSGDLVLVAEAGHWFSYYYWLDDAHAPDFAPTVDIHRKPGYDPCELFIDPQLRLPALRVIRRLAQKFLGFRYLMDVIPLDATLVKGSHGRAPSDPAHGPVFVSSQSFGNCGPAPQAGLVEMQSVKSRVLSMLELPD